MCLHLIVRWSMHLKFLLNMFVVKSLRLNKFRMVSIPSNKDLFLRVGKRALPPMQDGQIASFSNGTMEELSNTEAQLLKPNQMPLAFDD